MEDSPRRKQEVKRAIERAKEQQASKKRQSQILPMKRRQNNINNTNTNHNINICNSTPLSITKEPAMKRQRLNNGGSSIVTPPKILKTNRKRNDNLINNNRVIVNTQNNHVLINGHHRNNNKKKKSKDKTMYDESGSNQLERVALFIGKYKKMVRGQQTFDLGWFSTNVPVLNGLSLDTKQQCHDIIVQEAKTWFNFKLAQDIEQMLNIY